MIVEIEKFKVRINEFKMMKIQYTKYRITVEDYVVKEIINREG